MPDQTLVTYSVLTGYKPTEDDLSEIIRSFNRTPTFGFLTMICNLLSLFPPTFEKEKFVHIQRFLSANLLDEQTWNLTNEKLPGVTPADRPIFSSWQVLFLLRKLLLEADDNGLHNPNPQENKESRFLLGKACLIANDLMVTREQEQKTEGLSPYKKADSNSVLDELLTQFLPTIELANPPEISRSVVRTLDYLEISTTHFPSLYDGKTLTEIFEKYSGVSLDKFLQMTIGIYGSLITKDLHELIDDSKNFNISKTLCFSNLNYTKLEVDSFYALTTIGLNDLKSRLESSSLSKTLHDRYDFTIFRRFPLLHLSEDVLTLIDLSLLVEKVSIGLYHTILNCLLDNYIDPKPFFQHWGKIFEKYVNNIFYSIYPNISNRFHPNTYFESKTERECFDGIVHYPEAAVVMEYKGGLLSATAKYSAESNALISEINKKFGDGEKDSGVRQLVTKIETLFHADSGRRLAVQNLDLSNIRKVYPVLIVNDLALQLGLANWKLKEIFDSALEARKIDSLISVKRLIVLTIDDLETLAPYLEYEDFSLQQFVDFYSNQEYLQFTHFLTREHWFEPMTTVKQALGRFLQERKINPRNNEKMLLRWDSFMDKIMTSFNSE